MKNYKSSRKLRVYLNWYPGVNLSTTTTYVRLQELLTELGLTVSSKKLVPPSTQVTCLGIVVNTVDFTISISSEKLEIIKAMCSSWPVKSTCTKKELQSFLGSLLYVAKCIKYARVFF